MPWISDKMIDHFKKSAFAGLIELIHNDDTINKLKAKVWPN
jgi:hypothetical protein